MLMAISNENYELAECPMWNVKDQLLYWTDIYKGNIWKYDPDNKDVKLAWEGNYIVGGFAFTQDNDMILCTEKGVYKIKKVNNSFLNGYMGKIFDINMDEDERFNDITTDPKGRIFAGTIKVSFTDGTLYRLEKGKEPYVVLRGLGISNGMSFSLDKKFFYHTDSKKREIKVYDYDIKTGDISNPRIFYKPEGKDGDPDGNTIDTKGNIWAAIWGASQVVCIDSSGKVIKRIKVPAKQVSSVMFGGSKINKLFITTAAMGALDMSNGIGKDGAYLGGKVYCCETDSRGRPEWPALI